MQLLALPAFLYIFWQIKTLWWSLPQSPSGNYSQKSKLKVIFFCFCLLLFYIFQLFVPLFTINYELLTLPFGYLFVVAGFWLCRMALAALGDNWASLLDYQIKPGQKLVTTGIYKYLKHPLYLGDILWLTGLELTLNSWLFIPLFFLLSFLFWRHSIKEDKLLAEHFKM
jgi:protein-S-isoprenylcysteine O-methyltransferase